MSFDTTVRVDKCAKSLTRIERETYVKNQPITISDTAKIITAITKLGGKNATYMRIYNKLRALSSPLSLDRIRVLITRGLKTGVFKTTDNKTFTINRMMIQSNVQNAVYAGEEKPYPLLDTEGFRAVSFGPTSGSLSVTTSQRC